MRTKITILSIAVISFLLSSCSTSVIFTSSENDAQIYVDGRKRGSGQSSVINIKKDNCVNVKVEKTGFLTESLLYCYNGMTFGSPKTRYIELKNDDAYDASITTDYANKDFEVTVSSDFDEARAWKIVSQIVTGYFDNLEMADRATGYMKTSWQTKSFTMQTIRTRVIVKQSNSNPLKYKIKILSEYANDPEQSVKDDDKFKEWDRVLRAYEGLVTEFQARLGKK